MNKADRIYVAGHQGLVGSALLKKLTEKGFRHLVTRTHRELDLLRQSEVENFFQKEKIDYVFLAAGKVGGIHANNTYKGQFIYENLLIATNIIHASYRCHVKKLLNLGSSCIYPKLATQPIQEEELLAGPLEPTNEPYAIAKIASIKMCSSYNYQYGTDFLSAMPTNLYGPKDHYDFENSHVLPVLLRKFHLAKLLEDSHYESIREDFDRFGYPASLQKNSSLSHDSVDQALKLLGITKGSVTLWGSGSPFREFLFVDDLADACLFLMEKCSAADIHEYVNVGSGEEIQIKALAQAISDVVGYKGEIFWDSSKPDGTPRKYLDSSRIHALGWMRKMELQRGLQETYQEYCRYAAVAL